MFMYTRVMPPAHSSLHISPHTHLPHLSSPIATQVLKEADSNNDGLLDSKVHCAFLRACAWLNFTYGST